MSTIRDRWKSQDLQDMQTDSLQEANGGKKRYPKKIGFGRRLGVGSASALAKSLRFRGLGTST